ANGRPLAMKGASWLVRDFDETNLNRSRPPGAGGVIFAGGGRGLFVVPGHGVSTTIRELEDRYRETTCGGQLATASVPFDGANEAASLRWLRLCLDGAKDSAPRPDVPVPPSHDQRCADCHVRFAATSYPGAENEPVPACMRCAQAVQRGRRASRINWTLEDLESGGLVAVVSADGNNLGALFSTIGSLADTAVTSNLVTAVFQQAHERALEAIEHYVDPVVGGDDIRVFLPPQRVLDYITELAIAVDELVLGTPTDDLAPELQNALPRLGIGIGAVVAPFHYPAARLISIAHDLEDTAKAACLRDGVRSAVDLRVIRSGQELAQGVDVSSKQAPSAIPLSLDDWTRFLGRARALIKVPSSQRSMLIPQDADQDDPERANSFRYQVARHDAWKRWFDACEIDWRDPERLASNLPSPQMVDVAGLMEMQRDKEAP
ncbi:MAG: hypothetical protein AB1Z98_25415, partial [Nannocystaceae bacterium]